MRKMSGFKIGKRLIRISGSIFRRTRKPTGFIRLGSPEPVSRFKYTARRLINWVRVLASGGKLLCFMKPRSGYIHFGQEPVNEMPVPKGHLAIYVGHNDGDFHRVLVPVIYVNHPLFGQLLREAEEEYGFNQQGGITIPCQLSEFESIQTLIVAGSGRRRLTWKRNHF